MRQYAIMKVQTFRTSDATDTLLNELQVAFPIMTKSDLIRTAISSYYGSHVAQVEKLAQEERDRKEAFAASEARAAAAKRQGAIYSPKNGRKGRPLKKKTPAKKEARKRAS